MQFEKRNMENASKTFSPGLQNCQLSDTVRTWLAVLRRVSPKIVLRKFLRQHRLMLFFGTSDPSGRLSLAGSFPVSIFILTDYSKVRNPLYEEKVEKMNKFAKINSELKFDVKTLYSL
ncbi:MAG: hypothetical protein II916_00520 [Oscillospiraceae bacterium]|nr:hypothetical protein [Oscillospiraceae bacterium]